MTIRKILTLTIVLSLFSFLNLFGNAFHVYKVDESGFPNVKIQYNLKQGSGADFNDQSPEMFTLMENGVDMGATLRIDSSQKAEYPPVNILLLLDISHSMNDKPSGMNQTKLQLATGAIKAMLDSLKFDNGSKIALITFSSWSNLVLNWTTDIPFLKQHLDGLSIQEGATDFKKAFNGNNAFLWDVMKQSDSTIPRHVVFISDGGYSDRTFNQADGELIIQLAQANKTIIHSATIIGNTNYEVSEVITYTGGRQVKPKDLNELLMGFKYLAHIIQKRTYTQMIYEAPWSCEEADKARDITVTWHRTGEDRPSPCPSYVAPESSIPIFEFNKNDILIGSKERGDTSVAVTMTQHGPTITIDSLEWSEEFFVLVDDWGGTKPPFQLSDGQSRTIKFKYVKPEPESKEISVYFMSADHPCPPLPELKITTACGGEIGEGGEFGDVMVTNNSTKTFSGLFTNTTAAALPVNITLGGTNADNFEIVSGGGEIEVPVGGTIEVEMKFTPDGVGERKATLSFDLPDACNQNFSLDFSGNGTPNAIEENYISGSETFNLALHPNPAADNVQLRFDINEYSQTKLEIYNSVGALVETLMDKNLGAGTYQADYSVSHLPNGIYVLRLTSGQHTVTSRLVIVK